MTDFFSYVNPVSGSSEYNKFQFAMRRYMANIRTIQLAQVISCTNNGGLSPVGTVKIQLLLNQTDAAGNVTALPIIFNVPYVRIQGGSNAVIIDPAPGDIGMVGFGDRDLSAIIASKAQSAPGSNRRFSLSDALWIGGMLNGTPTQYVQFSSSGINVTSPTKIVLTAPQIELAGATTIDNTLHVKQAQTNDTTITATGEVTGNGIELSQHVHPGVQTGSSSTGLPVG